MPALSFPGSPCHPRDPDGDSRRPEADSIDSTFRAVLSPCTGVCTLGDDGLCHGCLRTSGEIARWMQMGDDERLRLMERVLPERESRRR